jgi:hypothetical protein
VPPEAIAVPEAATLPEAAAPPDSVASPPSQGRSADYVVGSKDPYHAEPPEETGADHGHDESVEEYMADLMKRLRGESGPEPVIDETPYVATGQQEVEEEQPAEPVIESAPYAEPEDPLEPDGFRPRNRAPESKTDLGALREVANTSARSAIVRHRQKRSGKGAFGKIVWAALALLAALAFGCWRSVLGPVAIAGAAILLITASLWIAQAGGLLGRAFLARRVALGGPVEESAETQPE